MEVQQSAKLQQASSSAAYSSLYDSLHQAAPQASETDLAAAAVRCLLLAAAPSKEQPPQVSDLATMLQLPTEDVLALVHQTPAQPPRPQQPAPHSGAQAASILADQRLHQLFEMWDGEGKGSLGFADVTLGLRRLCTTAQKLPTTAADAAEVLLQFGSEYSPRLDRAQFAAFVGALCQELGLSFDEAADLLVVLAAVPPDPQDHMAALLGESAVVAAFKGQQPGRTDSPALSATESGGSEELATVATAAAAGEDTPSAAAGAVAEAAAGAAIEAVAETAEPAAPQAAGLQSLAGGGAAPVMRRAEQQQQQQQAPADGQ